MFSKIKTGLVAVLAFLWAVVYTVAQVPFRYFPLFLMLIVVYAYAQLVGTDASFLVLVFIGLLLLIYMETADLRRELRSRKSGVSVTQNLVVPAEALERLIAERLKGNLAGESTAASRAHKE